MELPEWSSRRGVHRTAFPYGVNHMELTTLSYPHLVTRMAFPADKHPRTRLQPCLANGHHHHSHGHRPWKKNRTNPVWPTAIFNPTLAFLHELWPWFKREGRERNAATFASQCQRPYNKCQAAVPNWTAPCLFIVEVPVWGRWS